MKKLPGIIALFLFIGVQAKAQKEVLFKMQYLPNHNYSSAMKMDMNMEMKFEADTATVNKMKERGEKMPAGILMQVQSNTKMDVKTGVLNADNDIPLVMNINSLAGTMKMNGKESIIPMPNTSKKIYAKFTKEGKMSIDSLVGGKVTDSVRNAVTKMIKNIQGNIVFPDKAMKVGETFVQSTPLNLPIAGMEAKMLGKTTYKLIAIENKKGYFDVNMVITMDMTNEKMSMDMTGGGNGKMVFDIVNSYPSTVQNSMNVVYSIKTPESKTMKMSGKMNMLMNMETTVTAAN